MLFITSFNLPEGIKDLVFQEIIGSQLKHDYSSTQRRATILKNTNLLLKISPNSSYEHEEIILYDIRNKML